MANISTNRTTTHSGMKNPLDNIIKVRKIALICNRITTPPCQAANKAKGPSWLSVTTLCYYCLYWLLDGVKPLHKQKNFLKTLHQETLDQLNIKWIDYTILVYLPVLSVRDYESQLQVFDVFDVNFELQSDPYHSLLNSPATSSL